MKLIKLLNIYRNIYRKGFTLNANIKIKDLIKFKKILNRVCLITVSTVKCFVNVSEHWLRSLYKL